MARGAIALVCLAFTIAVPLRASGIDDVRLSRGFFNPSLGERVSLQFTLASPARVDVLVVDRDGFAVRELAKNKAEPSGTVTLQWDGRNASGELVPDESWSLKIDAHSSAGTSTYFPADAAPEPMISIRPDAYSPAASTLRYTLPVASRVHIQAGTASSTAGNSSTEGAVMKTIVDRAPRVAGSVVEQWNGLDESGTIRVPDQRNFVMAIAATPLPENSIITVGNRTKTFLQFAEQRHGRSLCTPRQLSHAHHAGLSALEDHSPPLRLRVGAIRHSRLPLTVSVDGPTASRFLRQHPTLFVFVDGERLLKTPADHEPVTVSVPWRYKPEGDHVIVVNWQSEFGPVAASATRIRYVANSGGSK
jgi:flagellar hook assembly protein FlgD